MFRRRSATEPAAPVSPSAPERPGSKGHPTPKRRESERNRRRRAKTPKTRKEAYKQARSRARDERMATRRALVTGDEKNLPPRDRGPVRAFARDYVDKERRAGELFLPGAVVVFCLNLVPSPEVQTLGVLLWLLLILTIVFSSVRLVRSLKREVAAEHPKESTKGLASYVVLRCMQVRRLRLPPPRVGPGSKRGRRAGAGG